MGNLIYDGTNYQIDDRPLQHLEAAVQSKLVRHESFLLSWTVPRDLGAGRIAVWMGPTIPVQFRFHGNRTPQLDRSWVELMLRISYTAHGLVLVDEEKVRAIRRGEMTIGDLTREAPAA